VAAIPIMNTALRALISMAIYNLPGTYDAFEKYFVNLKEYPMPQAKTTDL
jgi:hypothetical protein